MDNGDLQNCSSQINNKWPILQLSPIHNRKEEKQSLLFLKFNNQITSKMNDPKKQIIGIILKNISIIGYRLKNNPNKV